MAPGLLQPAGQMSPYSVPSIQQRHDSVKIQPSYLGASLRSSARACFAIGHQIRYSNKYRKATDFMGSGFIPLIDEFHGMGSAFQEIARLWSDPHIQELWAENATHTVKIVQEVVQGIATSIRGMTVRCPAWSIVVPDRVFHDLQRYQIWLQRQQLILNLLGSIMRTLSPSEEPNVSYCKRHPHSISL